MTKNHKRRTNEMNKIKTDIQWGFFSEVVGAESIIDGLENTNKVLSRDDIPENSIWEFCKQVREETGDDGWYVPAIYELEEKYPNGFDAEKLGYNGLWSSTEYLSSIAYFRSYNGNTYYYYKGDMSGSGWCYGVELFHKETE